MGSRDRIQSPFDESEGLALKVRCKGRCLSRPSRAAILFGGMFFSILQSPALASGNAPTKATIAGVALDQLQGRGAAVRFVEHEAENAVTNATLIGPDRTFTTLPSEASGRRAVLLQKSGDYVEFTLDRPANAITVRYALPDGRDGMGHDSTLGVYVAGERIGSLATTSRYGWFYGAYPFSNRPDLGKPHHFYDEARLLLERTLPAGARLRLMKSQRDGAPWYAIDLADFELVPPAKTRPAGALVITDFGADPSGKRDSWSSIGMAIAAARRRGVAVWIPPGTFKVSRHIIVDRVTIAGAGMWHAILRGKGIYGREAPRGSRSVELRDFALIGDVTERRDEKPLAGIGGALGGGSIIEDLWIQHHKVGVWLDGPLAGVSIRRLRILDNTADGLNLRRGVTNALVEHVFVRNSGDDGLAMWSHREANRNNAFRNNTVVAPILANGIAIYGGHNIEVSGNFVADTLTQGGGIHLGNRFDAVPLSGQIKDRDNLLVRAGSYDPNWRFGVGALWFYALDHPIAATIEVKGVRIEDSTLPALHLIGKRIQGVTFEDVNIRRAGSHALQVQSPGVAKFKNVRASGLVVGGQLECAKDFELIDLGHNSGWADRHDQPCN